MSELNLMVTIANRPQVGRFLELYREHGLEMMLVTVGRGTAASEMLDYFGLESSERAVLMTVVTDTVWKKVKRGLQREMRIDVPGTGIAFTVPLSSVGGKKQLDFLTENQDFVQKEESALKNTEYELLMVIANQGYSEMVMDAARKANAGGGTIIHAKGTGMERGERFFGVSLASEKEMIMIVAKHGDKNAVMRAIMDEAGMNSKAKSIVFSMPVTSVAGMRLMEESAED